MIFNIGYDGEEREGSWAPEEPRGFWEVGDPFMFPRSLYLNQLKDRLGLDSVLNIATLSQLSGNLWDELGEWQGYGSIEDGSESAAEMILPNWLADRGLSSTTEIIPEFGNQSPLAIRHSQRNFLNSSISVSKRAFSPLTMRSLFNPAPI